MENPEPSTSVADEQRRNRVDQFLQDHEFKRISLFDKNRQSFIKSEAVTEEDIHGMCSRIKRRKHATEEDLVKLANAFLQNEANITAFMKVTGAINVLVKEFIGFDQSRQLLAAQCLCNISLGNEVCCGKLAHFAGCYLMIFVLSPMDVSLCKICLWTAQNITATGNKGFDILMRQELLRNCLKIIREYVDFYQDAMFLLDLIIEKRKNEISENHDVQRVVWEALKKKPGDAMTLQVFFRIISLNGPACFLSQDEALHLIKLATSNLQSNEEHVLYFSVKILSHTAKWDPQALDIIFDSLTISNTQLSNLVNKSTVNPKQFFIFKDLIHLITILKNHSPQYLAFDPIENLKIPEMFNC